MEHLAELLRLWPSADGRLNRKGYWLHVVWPGAALAIFSGLAFFGTPSLLGKAPQSLYVVACVVFARTADIYSIRRYHDLGKPGQAHKLLRPLIVILPTLAFVVWVSQPVEAVGEFSTETLIKGFEARSFPPVAAPLAILG